MVTKNATTKNQGERNRKCTRTGCDANEKASIAILAEDGHEHNFGEWKTITETTCLMDGVTQRECSICRQTEDKTIVAIGHRFGEWIIVSEATNEKEGISEQVCEICGEKNSEKIPKLSNDVSSGASKKYDRLNDKNPNMILIIAITVLSVFVIVSVCVIVKMKNFKFLFKHKR